MILKIVQRNKQAILYGSSLALLLFLLKWLELRLVVIDHAFELYIGAIAFIFTGLGIWLALKLSKPKTETKTIVIEKEIYKTHSGEFITNEKELKKRGISKRELEVLQLIAEGLTNREIADRLFVSENTIKTHSSNLFEKMEVERRTQAIDKAKKLNLIP